MNSFIFVLAIFAVSALAIPAKKRAVDVYPDAHQFRSQNIDGRYAYAYLGGPSAKYESRTKEGVVQGSYSYIDAYNKLQTVNYRSDPELGFRVALTNLPEEPAAVIAARAAHLKAWEKAAALAAASDEANLIKKNKI